MSRTCTSGIKLPSSEQSASSFVNVHTGRALIVKNGLEYCLELLKLLLDCWKATAAAKDSEGSVVSGQLLKPRPAGSPPDMSPFFLRQYVKSHANNVFEDYPLLLMEIILRLPYQMKKIAESHSTVVMPAFDATWYKLLTEYMMTQPQHVPFVRRQVRKLLLFICGSKDKYRQLRDMNFIETHMSSVRSTCEKRGIDPLTLTTTAAVPLSYDVLISLIDHLKCCLDIATSRTINWQKYCQKDEGVLPFLVLASVSLDDGIAPLILQLLQCALCGSKALTDQSKASASSGATAAASPAPAASSASAAASPGPGSTPAAPSKSKTGREKKDEKPELKSSEKRKEEDLSRYDEALCKALVLHAYKSVGRDLLVRFIVCFLLESNLTSVRWQAHALILHIYRSSSANQREALLELMWTIWPDLPMYGGKAAQFVDLLGYFTIKTPQSSDRKMKQYVEKALALLRTENKALANHPNGSIYNILQGLVDFDGYYLEHDPCLVCNNPEIPFANIKLSSIKVDSKFTTTMQIVKLSGSHTISKILLKITDIKRAKMVRTLIVHYNNRQVQAVVELKNKPGLWHRAKKVVLSANQSEVKVEFPLPIVACNLMVEYADFYDNAQASAETLQCPRCSASVPANPGVCGNCGENVFQCHKCRAINYDEKDPFLCNACGYCKYAKFDFSLTSRPCCAVDPIENDDDRKRAVTTINALLDKADHQYKLLQERKAALESLLVHISDHNADRPEDATPAPTPASAAVAAGAAGAGASAASGASTINKNIQLLAQKYCVDCRNAFEELSKILQKVLASRKELVDYDRQQQEAAQSATIPLSASTPSTPTLSPRPSELFVGSTEPKLGLVKPREKRSRCFGCTSATVEHCITLLRAMATNPTLKSYLCGQGMIRELVDYNLRRGSASLRSEVRHLLCLMSNNNSSATEELVDMLTRRVVTAVHGHLANPDFAATVRHEMLLLSNLLQLEDSLWEQRVRCVMKLFIMSMRIDSPAILECISLPCLRILQHIIRPAAPTSKKNKDKTIESLSSVHPLTSDLRVDVHAWLAGVPSASFQSWKQHMPTKACSAAEATPAAVPAAAAAAGKKKKDEKHEKHEKPRDKDVAKQAVHTRYLMEKYAAKWRIRVLNAAIGRCGLPLKLLDKTWLRTAMFSPSSSAIRQTECNIVEAMCLVPSRKQDILDVLSSFLDEVGSSGEAASEFLVLYKKLIAKEHWKYYLAVKGVPVCIAALISKEIVELSRMEETSLSSDLSQGFALKSLTDLLAAFLEVENIKHHYKNRLVGSVLNGYLSLRKLVVQRTKMIDDTQDKLLELLEEMTTGTESETKEFMSVCVETINKYPLHDFLSPVFIFERLCSIIFPEANDTTEFFLTLEKDPQQEDFLQGRMLGNPYSSNEPGLGPLMRDVKNKICQDCELVALLEDDTGMELLVCNKIISLDLPVADVHRKIWMAEHGENEAMRVVYRMRGLLGDATEDMVNSLDSGKDEDVDNEEVYKMANVMSQCGGLQVMLKRLAAVRNLVTGKQLMTVLLKLFDFCLKVKANRQELIKVELNAVSTMLGALNLALLAEQESVTATKGQTLTEQILQIMETILLEASSMPHDIHKEFSKLCGDKEQLIMLLDRINSPFVRSNASVLQALMRLIPFLAFGDYDKMQALVNHFRTYLDFNKYDFEHTQDEQIHLDCFCVIAQGIENNSNGRKLKDLIGQNNIVRDTLHYIQMHAPASKSDPEGWKEFVSKSSLPYVLRLLTGLCAGHPPTQVLIGQEVLPILHNLEQVSSDEHVGSLAENLLEALKENEEVAAKIEEVRQQTKAEKKRLAMAMREKQLVQLGMMANDKGQVTVKGSVLKQMEDLKEETGLTCCICREGYRYQPAKVLGIYTFTKRVTLDEGEAKPRRAQGYSTVSHFNVIHVECHLAAVRHARGREEWESAALQNGNTRCNGLLPLWGPQVPESAYAGCLARHNTYLQECTGVRDATYAFTVHDLKHLLIKFSHEKSFSEDTGGGGRESNIYLVPYIMHMALYVINTTRSVGREEKNLSNFLKLSVDKWVENSFETEGALYWTVMALHINDVDNWKKIRLQLLKRIIVLAHARNVSSGGASSLTDKAVKEYSVYKPYLMFFGLANCLPTILFAKCHVEPESNWSSALAEYIRNNDQLLQENAKKVLSTFEDELLPCETFEEFCDVAGLLEDIAEPDKLISEVLQSLP